VWTHGGSLAGPNERAHQHSRNPRVRVKTTLVPMGWFDNPHHLCPSMKMIGCPTCNPLAKADRSHFPAESEEQSRSSKFGEERVGCVSAWWGDMEVVEKARRT